MNSTRMKMNLTKGKLPVSCLAFWMALVAVILAGGPMAARAADSIHGKITSSEGALEGGYVAAHAAGKTFTIHVMTDNGGQYAFRDLAPGTDEVYTRIPGFRTARKEGVVVQAGREAAVDFRVEAETDPRELVEHMTNSELMVSFPGTEKQKELLIDRCGGCHGAYYLAKSRFTRKDWGIIVRLMDSGTTITPVGDVRPPVPRRGRDDQYAPRYHEDGVIVDYLTEFRGPDSPDLDLKLFPLAKGEATRAVVTEYQIPRKGAYPHDVMLDEEGTLWFNDWKANYLGKIDRETGEIKEYLAEGNDMPGGFLSMLFDHNGDLWAGQLWSGLVTRFNPRTEQFTGAWHTPFEYSRTGTVGVCQNSAHPEGPVWLSDALHRGHFWKLNPETGEMTETNFPGGRFKCDSEGNIWRIGRGKVFKIHPASGEVQEYNSLDPDSDPHRFSMDGDENVWYGDWDGRKLTFLDTKTGQMTDFPALTPYSLVYNAVGDSQNRVGWAVPHVSDQVVKADRETGEVSEFPLPSRGHAVRNLVLDTSTDPPSIWFVNQRMGRIVQFQEYQK